MSRKFALGLDYGTESARALLVDTATGEEIATAVMPYPDGVIDEALPGTGAPLPPDWALQNPQDYLTALDRIVPEVLARAGVDGADVVGIGVDFTACTLIPVDADGTPLSMRPEWAAEPHAWPKLWKHHGAQAQADRMTELAERRGYDWLAGYGGKISSEWLFPKALEVLEQAPDVYLATDRFIEAGDWLVMMLTGEEKRNACAAGYKALWNEAYPEPEFFRLLDPAFENVVADKLAPEVHPMGAKAGGLTGAIAAKLGLRPGTAVAVAGIDAHVAVPAATVTGPGKMVMIMGTSLCHMVCGERKSAIPGLCGVVKDGILPGLYGYEAGQAAVGDLFAWYIEHGVPKAAHDDAAARGEDLHAHLSREAAQLPVGANGLVCLDWWNGNRSILVDANLSGLMVGLTLATTPAEIYRALLEATAFGTYTIIQQLENGGCPIESLYACGGLPNKNPLLMQIFADVTGREIHIAAGDQTVALGAAMWGAVAAGAADGGHDDIGAAAKKMARLRRETYRPNPANHKAYAPIFAEYRRLHDLFGRGAADTMKTLKEIRRRARA